jgi:hypothetical protein
LYERLDEGQVQFAVIFLADRSGGAELEHGLPMCFGSGHAGADVVLGLLREVIFHFFEQALIRAIRAASAACEV